MSFINTADAESEDGVKYEFENGIHDRAEIYTDYVGETDDGQIFDLSGASYSFIGQKGTSTSVLG